MWETYSCTAVCAAGGTVIPRQFRQSRLVDGDSDPGSLLGLWLAFAEGKKLPWCVLPGSAIAFAVICACDKIGPRPDASYVPLLIGQLGCIIVAGLVMRLTGLRLVGVNAPAELGGPFQFSLLDIFNWMTAAAVGLSILKCLPEGQFDRAWWQLNLAPACVVNGACASLTLASLWLIFGRRWLALRCVSCLALVVLDAIGVDYSVGHSLVGYVVPFAAHPMGWLTASLLAIRFAGFRLVWRWRFANTADVQPQSDAEPVAVAQRTYCRWQGLRGQSRSL